ncbi:MAG: hypothetical protein D6732_06645 [Methanobacteriota archaeon]|nr:MAG: hypothetical protein D6732_06645 [Euryarchaeota archaeon]
MISSPSLLNPSSTIFDVSSIIIDVHMVLLSLFPSLFLNGSIPRMMMFSSSRKVNSKHIIHLPCSILRRMMTI